MTQISRLIVRLNKLSKKLKIRKTVHLVIITSNWPLHCCPKVKMSSQMGIPAKSAAVYPIPRTRSWKMKLNLMTYMNSRQQHQNYNRKRVRKRGKESSLKVPSRNLRASEKCKIWMLRQVAKTRCLSAQHVARSSRNFATWRITCAPMRAFDPSPVSYAVSASHSAVIVTVTRTSVSALPDQLRNDPKRITWAKNFADM